MKPLILDLCGGSGAWSEPYKKAGYNVINIDPIHETGDVRLFYYPDKLLPVTGILAAPPCDAFAGSGAQYWPAKDIDGRTIEGISIVDACLRMALLCRPVFWALENPVGRLRRWLGPPKMYFNPCDFGDPYTKKSCLWGQFNKPKLNPIEPVKVCSQGSWVQKLGGKSQKTKYLRGITPPGFARAFFEANNPAGKELKDDG